MSLQAVLMCGGLGTRLRPWSYVIPKPMFPVGERPILELLLERLRLNDITEIYISLGYKAELIQSTFKDGSQYGVKLHYVCEQEPLGTAGALNLFRDSLRDSFLMMNGDLVTRLDFKKLHQFHQDHNAAITVGTKLYNHQVPYGVIEDSDGKVTGLVEKPTYSTRINAGIYIINHATLDLLPNEGRFDATQLIQAAMNAGRSVHSYLIEEYWLDIGRLEDYERANEDAKRWLDEDRQDNQERQNPR
jgi:NDP-sugar pyrophosphorylase family protein